jgi:hypothetical protein
MANDSDPYNIDIFTNFLIFFVAVFGILYSGHSFPDFRGKGSTINYLMVPSSVLEKFLFEFFSRLSIVIFLLPILFWITYNFQGYFFNLLTDQKFQAVGFKQLLDFKLLGQIKEQGFWFFTLISSLIILVFVLPFVGGTMFFKQPLVKTLFAVTLIVISYAGFLYFLLEPLGIGLYEPNDTTWLIPHNKEGGMRFFGSFTVIANLVFLFVAYRKLKEKEI